MSPSNFQAWDFTATEELPGGHCSRVYASETLVLKVPFQGEEQTTGLTAALRLGASLGPKILNSDVATGAILMERIRPGTSLAHANLPDQDCREILGNLARKIRLLNPEDLMPVRDFVQPGELAEHLEATTQERVFLHGDLHHENVLWDGSRWVVIDPKGLVGDPAFEYSAYTRNPVPWLTHQPNLSSLLERRIEQLAQETACDPFRIWAWSLLALGEGPHDGNWQPVYDALLHTKFNNLRPS